MGGGEGAIEGGLARLPSSSWLRLWALTPCPSPSPPAASPGGSLRRDDLPHYVVQTALFLPSSTFVSLPLRRTGGPPPSPGGRSVGLGEGDRGVRVQSLARDKTLGTGPVFL